MPGSLPERRTDNMLVHLWPGGTNDYTARSRYRPDHSAAAAARPQDDDAAERARSASRARSIARRRPAAASTERKRYGSEGRGRTACRARLSRLTRKIADGIVLPWRRLGRRRSRNP